MNDTAFVFLGDVNVPWIYPLAVELSRNCQTLLIQIRPSILPFIRDVRWPFDDKPPQLIREVWDYPPGFNGKLGALFDRSIRTRLTKSIKRLAHFKTVYVIASNPMLTRYLEELPAVRLVYLVYDDYGIDSPSTPEPVRASEERTVNRATAVLCSSSFLTDRYKSRFHTKAKAVYHFPHGVHELFINTEPKRLPECKTVCSVGQLTSRYDWNLIYSVACKLPDIKFSFVGPINTWKPFRNTEGWERLMQKTLLLPNVAHVSGVSYRDCPLFYWGNSINWMPYRSDLPFVQASCPLRIMDGIASGRKILSADIPESRHYPQWISIFRNDDEAVSMISSHLSSSTADAGNVLSQIAFAQQNTWRDRAKALRHILS